MHYPCNIRIPFTVTLAILGGTTTAIAQEQDDTAPATLDAVTVTGVPLPGDPLSQAPSVDIITRDAINEQGAVNLGEALADEAGVNNLSTGTSSGKPVIRGLSGERVRIVADGIGLDHQQYGVRHMPTYDPFLYDAAEVVRGASSVLYGSSALGGTVNLRAPRIAYDSAVSGESLLRFRSNNRQWDSGLTASGGNGRFGFHLGLIRHDAGNIRTPSEPTYFPPPPEASKQDAPAYTGELRFTDSEQVNGSLAGGYRADDGSEWRVRYSRWDNEHNFLLPPPAGNEPPGAGPEGIGQFIDDQQLTLEGEAEVGDILWKPKLKWQNNRRRSNAAGTPRSAGFDGTIDIEFDQYTARLEGENGPWAGLDGGTIGVEYTEKHQESRGSTQLAPGGRVTNTAAFAFQEKDLGPILFQAGLRYDHRKIEARSSRTRNPSPSVTTDNAETYDVATGSLGAVVPFTENLSLAANAGRGFRAPTLFERHVAGQHGGVAAFQVGNPNLEPETSIDTDLSLRWDNRANRLEITAYRNRIDDFIVLRDTGNTRNGLPVFQYEQTDAIVRGIELDAETTVADWLTLFATAERVEGRDRRTGSELPTMPADNATAGARFHPKGSGWLTSPRGGIKLRYEASKDAAPGEPFSQFDNAPFGSASTQSHTLIDLNAGFTVAAKHHPLDVDLAIHNVLDEDYRGFLDTYKGYALSPGRDIRLTVRIPF